MHHATHVTTPKLEWLQLPARIPHCKTCPVGFRLRAHAFPNVCKLALPSWRMCTTATQVLHNLANEFQFKAKAYPAPRSKLRKRAPAARVEKLRTKRRRYVGELWINLARLCGSVSLLAHLRLDYHPHASPHSFATPQSQKNQRIHYRYRYGESLPVHIKQSIALCLLNVGVVMWQTAPMSQKQLALPVPY